jgi:hypothetical protein
MFVFVMVLFESISKTLFRVINFLLALKGVAFTDIYNKTIGKSLYIVWHGVNVVDSLHWVRVPQAQNRILVEFFFSPLPQSPNHRVDTYRAVTNVFMYPLFFRRPGKNDQLRVFGKFREQSASRHPIRCMHLVTYRACAKKVGTLVITLYMCLLRDQIM